MHKKINWKNYPIANKYLKEIKKQIKQKNYLSIILLCGTLGELILREIMNDEETYSVKKVLEGALRESKIRKEQFALFESIRKIRNKYIHISSNKILYSGFAMKEKDDSVSMVNEIVLNKYEATEKHFEKLFNIHSIIDSRDIYNYLQKLIASLNM